MVLQRSNATQMTFEPNSAESRSRGASSPPIQHFGTLVQREARDRVTAIFNEKKKMYVRARLRNHGGAQRKSLARNRWSVTHKTRRAGSGSGSRT